MSSAAAVAAALSMLVLPARASGQTFVSGTVADAETGRPVEGVAVRVVPRGAPVDEAVAGTFSDADGRFRLELERPGRHRLVAERIGYRAHEGGVFLVRLGDEAERDIELRPESVRLADLEVTGRRACDTDPATAETVQRLWREARRALEAARWTAEHASVETRTRNFSRRLDPGLNVEETLEATPGSGTGVTPYRSLPAEELSERGYVDTRGDHFEYYGPDAEALLSEAFRRDHCFWVTGEDAPRPGWIGLAFEPVDGRDVPEIEGVLWLERASAELKRLEFEYVNLPLPTSGHAAGGEVEFFRLPSGPWVVLRWALRMPEVVREDLRISTPDRHYHREEYEVASYQEEGGRVVRIADGDRTLYDFERATLAGVVHDSLRDGPREGAVVELVGTGRVDTTDAQGRYRFVGVPEGSYLVRARIPLLEGLGMPPISTEVQVTRGGLVESRLAVPGAASLARRVCPDGGDAGALAGRVRTASGASVPGARVAAVWARDAGEAIEGPEGHVHRAVRADDRGLFRICGVPPGTELAVRAEHEAGVGAVDEVRLAAPGLVVHELEIESGAEAERLASLVREQGLGGAGREGRADGPAGAPGALEGAVRAAADDRPLPAAEVRVGGRRVAVADDEGRFTVDGLEAGRHRVRVSYLGFESQEALVRVPAGDTVRSTVLMETDPVPLPELAVRVEGTDIPARLAGLGQRMRRGGGHFITREEIEKLPGDDVTDALRGVPGLRVVPCPMGGGECIETTRSRQTRLTTRTAAEERARGITPEELGQDVGSGEPDRFDRFGVGNPIPDSDELPMSQPCGVAVFVDGAPRNVVARSPDNPADPRGAVFGFDAIPKQDVEAIEVYTGTATIPVQFKNSATGCAKAAIVIWTRRGGRTDR